MALYCGAWAIVATTEDGVALAHPLYCKSWACHRCARLLRRRLISRLNGVRVFSLLTLTSNPARWRSPDDAFRGMSHEVNVLFKRIRRRYPGAPIEYFLVWETTKNGWPHAHVLLQAPIIPSRWLKVVWDELTGAPVIDIRRVADAAGAIAYVAKYLSKDLNCPDRMKRFRASRRFFNEVDPDLSSRFSPSLRWCFKPQSTSELARDWSLSGLTVHRFPDGSIAAYPRGHPDAPSLDSVTAEASWKGSFS